MNNNTINCAEIEEWINDDYSENAIKESLQSKGYESGVITQYLCEFKRLKMQNLLYWSLMFVTFGAMLGVVSLFLHK